MKKVLAILLLVLFVLSVTLAAVSVSQRHLQYAKSFQDATHMNES